MKDAVVLTLAFITVCVAIFMGATILLKNAIKSTPKIERDEDYIRMLRDERRRMEGVQDRQKDLMRDQRQRIRDMQRN